MSSLIPYIETFIYLERNQNDRALIKYSSNIPGSCLIVTERSWRLWAGAVTQRLAVANFYFQRCGVICLCHRLHPIKKFDITGKGGLFVFYILLSSENDTPALASKSDFFD